MLMNTESIYYCKRLRTLNFLISRGFTEYEVIPDPTSKKGYNWFIFKRTPALDKAVEEYFSKLK